MDKAAFRDFTVQIIKRSDRRGLGSHPRRWVVERTFDRWRRLVRDYEERIDDKNGTRIGASCQNKRSIE